MKSPLEHLKEWHEGHDYLLVLLETVDARLTVKAEGFIKDPPSDEIIIQLENTSEIGMRLDGADLKYLDATEDVSEVLRGAVIIKWPGFRLSLSLLRKQPVIHYPAD